MHVRTGIWQNYQGLIGRGILTVQEFNAWWELLPLDAREWLVTRPTRLYRQEVEPDWYHTFYANRLPRAQFLRWFRLIPPATRRQIRKRWQEMIRQR